MQNESINGHYKNASFMCADVTSQDLVLQANSMDLIFSNWLLMYLSDEEVIDSSIVFLDLLAEVVLVKWICVIKILKGTCFLNELKLLFECADRNIF